MVQVGSQVKDWKVGDRAGVKPLHDVCHNCNECYNGRENYCDKALQTGLHTPGTYQQYLTKPAIYTSRIPDGVSDEMAGPIMCSASTMHRALIESELKPSNWVVFPGGGGGVGIQGVQLARCVLPEALYSLLCPVQMQSELTAGQSNGHATDRH